MIQLVTVRLTLLSPLPPCLPQTELDLPRYKIVVQVTIGEMKSQGVRVASRCLWDTDSDNYASYSFKNVSVWVFATTLVSCAPHSLLHPPPLPQQESLWCVAMVFGCYTE